MVGLNGQSNRDSTRMRFSELGQPARNLAAGSVTSLLIPTTVWLELPYLSSHPSRSRCYFRVGRYLGRYHLKTAANMARNAVTCSALPALHTGTGTATTSDRPLLNLIDCPTADCETLIGSARAWIKPHSCSFPLLPVFLSSLHRPFYHPLHPAIHISNPSHPSR